jgi:putative membrane protein insertion efficiency factor
MRPKLLAGVAVLLVAAVADAQRPPAAQFMTTAAVGGIHLYQATLSKWYARAGVQCRFTPTCSHYGEAVIRRFGATRGGWLAMRRVVRCGPWTPMGTADPPPLGS